MVTMSLVEDQIVEDEAFWSRKRTEEEIQEAEACKNEANKLFAGNASLFLSSAKETLKLL